MSIRLRQVEGRWIALCAARSIPKEGDIYLDDAHHEALGAKFAREYNESWGLNIPYNGAELNLLVEIEESNNPNRALWDVAYGGKNE